MAAAITIRATIRILTEIDSELSVDEHFNMIYYRLQLYLKENIQNDDSEGYPASAEKTIR